MENYIGRPVFYKPRYIVARIFYINGEKIHIVHKSNNSNTFELIECNTRDFRPLYYQLNWTIQDIHSPKQSLLSNTPDSCKDSTFAEIVSEIRDRLRLE